MAFPAVTRGAHGGSGSCNTVLQLCPHCLRSVPALPALRRRLSCLGVRGDVAARCHPCWRVVCAPLFRHRRGCRRRSGRFRHCRSMQAPLVRRALLVWVLGGASCFVGRGAWALPCAGALRAPSGDLPPGFRRSSVRVAVSFDRVFSSSCAMPRVARGPRDDGVTSRLSGSASALRPQHRRL